LKLAWRLTIHKSLAYVAFARAGSANGLSVNFFGRQLVHTDAVARKFHETVTSNMATKDSGQAKLAMLDEASPWRHALLKPLNQGFLRLFMRSEHFQRLFHGSHRQRNAVCRNGAMMFYMLLRLAHVQRH
jgi:hypothetical protein